MKSIIAILKILKREGIFSWSESCGRFNASWDGNYRRGQLSVIVDTETHEAD